MPHLSRFLHNREIYLYDSWKAVDLLSRGHLTQTAETPVMTTQDGRGYVRSVLDSAFLSLSLVYFLVKPGSMTAVVGPKL